MFPLSDLLGLSFIPLPVNACWEDSRCPSLGQAPGTESKQN